MTTKTQRIILHPLVLMCVPTWGVYCLWLITPADYLATQGLGIKADAWTGLLIGLAAFLAFGAGYGVEVLFGTRSARNILINEDRLHRQLLVLLLLGWACMIIIVVGIVWTGGYASLVMAMSGMAGAYSIPGLTTFVHLSSALVPLTLCLWTMQRRRHGRSAKGLTLILFLSVLLCVTRMIVGGERLALYIPGVASAAVAVALMRQNVKSRILSLCFWGIIFAGIIFVASEALRSYKVKYSSGRIELGLWEYSLPRWHLYYVTSTNAGIAQISLGQELGQDTLQLFQTTLNPLAQLLNAANISLGSYASNVRGALIAERSKLAEYTNIWGAATPFMEGKFYGLAYWFFWGVCFGIVYRRLRENRCGAIDMPLYGIMIAGLLDASRILVLGGSAILVALGILVTLRLYWSAASVPLPSGAPRPSQGAFRTRIRRK